MAYVEVAAAYACQTHYLNVALTAVGLQWTISDFLKTEYRLREDGCVYDADDDTELAAVAVDDPADGVEPVHHAKRCRQHGALCLEM